MELVAIYIVKQGRVEVMECGSGDDIYYGLYLDGVWINEGEPWYKNGEGIPTRENIQTHLTWIYLPGGSNNERP
tara:strand:- start:14634 stop:14855 length:222 start_codon:yes stop_codon:yes gene_type:complete